MLAARVATDLPSEPGDELLELLARVRVHENTLLVLLALGDVYHSNFVRFSTEE